MTLNSSGGLAGGSAGECNAGYLDTLSVEAASRTLSWDFCDFAAGGTRIARGMRVLSGPEYQAVLNALSLVAPSSASGCGADKPRVTLKVEAAGTSRIYRDDFYSCLPAEGAEFVSDVDPISAVLTGYARASEFPKELSSLYLAVASDVVASPAAGSTCGPDVPARYELTVATHLFTWELCARAPGSNVYTEMNGSRTLSQSELSAVLTGYAGLKFGADKPCSELALPVRSASQGSAVGKDETVYFSASEGSCSSDLSGTPVTGVSELEKVMDGLVP